MFSLVSMIRAWDRYASEHVVYLYALTMDERLTLVGSLAQAACHVGGGRRSGYTPLDIADSSHVDRRKTRIYIYGLACVVVCISTILIHHSE
jgi:hypothetical protein